MGLYYYNIFQTHESVQRLVFNQNNVNWFAIDKNLDVGNLLALHYWISKCFYLLSK